MRAVLAAALTLGGIGTAHAQSVGWHAKGQASASLSFGATQQQLIVTEANLSRADSTAEVATTIQFRYGETSDTAGVRSVSARAWLGSLSVDARPFATISPFVFGSLESSLAQRIERRFSGGAGAKWTVQRSDAGHTSVSLALLGERSRLDVDSAGVPDAEITQSVARWSARFKFDRKIGERVTLSQVTFYKPVISDFARFLVTSTSQASFAVNKTLALTLSLIDNYDSEATGRGARSNNDGQLLFGVQASR